jgi:hypothetical protein
MKKIFITLLLLCAFNLSVNAQDTLQGPHRGVLVTTGAVQIESTGCNGYLEVYLYDQNKDALLNYGIAGDVKYYRADGSGSSEKLVYYGTDGFTAKFPNYGFSYYVVIVVMKGTTYSARFNNQCGASVSQNSGK